MSAALRAELLREFATHDANEFVGPHSNRWPWWSKRGLAHSERVRFGKFLIIENRRAWLCANFAWGLKEPLTRPAPPGENAVAVHPPRFLGSDGPHRGPEIGLPWERAGFPTSTRVQLPTAHCLLPTAFCFLPTPDFCSSLVTAPAPPAPPGARRIGLRPAWTRPVPAW